MTTERWGTSGPCPADGSPAARLLISEPGQGVKRCLHPTRQKAKLQQSGREGPDPAAGGAAGLSPASLPHVARVPVLVELVHVVGVPGERAQLVNVGRFASGR